MPVNLRNAIGVLKVIAIEVKNKVRRLCFGGALLSALFLKRVSFLEKNNFEEKLIFEVMRFLF